MAKVTSKTERIVDRKDGRADRRKIPGARRTPENHE